MPTLTPLYPNGFEFTDAALSDFFDDNHQTIVPLAFAAATYWQQCQAMCGISITIHDYPLPGNTTIIGTTLGVGVRRDFFGGIVLQDEPRKLVGVKGFDNYTTDFASPMEFDSVFVAGQTFGPDNTYSGQYKFRGDLWFNVAEALPFIFANIAMGSSNGAVFQLTVAEPVAFANRTQGDFLTIDGQSLKVWFAWSGAAIPVAPPEMTATVTTTQTVNWPVQ